MARTTQIFCASTLYGAATVAAALDAGLFEPADRRLLLVTNNTAAPEITPGLDEMSGFDRVRERFDGVLSWNEAISPFHPSGWSPRADDIPIWERHLRLLWNLGDDDIQLAVESVQVNPALALCRLFTGAPVDVYADGLMSYGPTRDKIDPLVGTSIRRLLHLDLVPGLKPLLLTEFGVEPELVPSEAFLKVLGELAESAATEASPRAKRSPRPIPATDPALLLGQYLSALSILTPEEEEELHLRMMRGAVARGHRADRLQAAPRRTRRTGRRPWRTRRRSSAPSSPSWTGPCSPRCSSSRPGPRSSSAASPPGCSPRPVCTASRSPGSGTDTLLERLAPYQNSNRVPLTIVDALLPDLEDAAAVRQVGDAVAQAGGRRPGRTGQGRRVLHAAEDLSRGCGRRRRSTSPRGSTRTPGATSSAAG